MGCGASTTTNHPAPPFETPRSDPSLPPPETPPKPVPTSTRSSRVNPMASPSSQPVVDVEVGSSSSSPAAAVCEAAARGGGAAPAAEDAPTTAASVPHEERLVTSKPGDLVPRSSTGYLGLMNQGATCYLNSLLQALFMTPSFRRLVLAWRFQPSRDGAAEFCIPYQLQRLFALLSVSERASVSTKELTHSFHWTSAESFRQHDIQELMRVLLDALARTLQTAGTDGEQVRQLFEGEFADYLQCGSCGYERARLDKFMDISLVVEGFESLSASLAHYVEPEVLSGDNMWRCSGCDHKVEARKFLQFKSVPSVLAFQLKRFVYDPERRSRVKLNHRMTFEETLDLADMLSSDTPVLYDLAAVLLHSGTALGGHYFAYLKLPGSGRWAEFNDVLVSYLPEENPLEKAFGGEKNGTSAYLLMYRARPEDENAPDEDELHALIPDDLRAEIEAADAKWKAEQLELERERRRMDLYVVYRNREHKFRFDREKPLHEVRDAVFARLAEEHEDLPAHEDMRLRFFAREIGLPQAPFTGREHEPLVKLGFRRTNTLMVETREPGDEFPEFNANEIPLRIKLVTPENVAEVVEHSQYPLVAGWNDVATVRVDHQKPVGELARVVEEVLGVPAADQRLVRLHTSRAEVLPAHDAAVALSALEFCAGTFVYCERRDWADGQDLLSVFEAHKCQVSVEFNHPDVTDERGNPLYSMSVRLSRNCTLRELKEKISPLIDVHVDEFRLRESSNGKRFANEADTLERVNLSDMSIVFVERGRPLQVDEFEIGVFFYEPSAPPKRRFRRLFEMPYPRMMRVSDMKTAILATLNDSKPDGRRGNTLGVEPGHFRLRVKNKRRATKIMLDNLTLGRCFTRLIDGCEIAVQKTDEENERVTTADIPVVIQQWHPMDRKLGPRMEVIVRKTDRVKVLKQAILRELNARSGGGDGGPSADDLKIAKGDNTRLNKSGIAELNFDDPKVVDELILTRMPMRLLPGDTVFFMDERELTEEQRAAIAEKLAAQKKKRKERARRGRGRGRRGRSSSRSSGARSRAGVPEHVLKIMTPEDWQAQVQEYERLQREHQAKKEQEQAEQLEQPEHAPQEQPAQPDQEEQPEQS